MSIFNSSKNKKKKSQTSQNIKYFSDYAEEKNTSEKPIPAPASSSARLSASITGSNQFGDMSVSEISGANPSGDFIQDFQESVERSRQINPEVLSQINSEVIEEENISDLYINYNTIADIKNIEQNESIKKLNDILALNHSSNSNQNNIVLLSHENYKITSLFENFFSGSRTLISSGTFINPDQLNILKTSYYKGKLSNISKRFFLNNNSDINHQATYINKNKQNFSKKNDFVNSFDAFIDISKEFTKEKNFANQTLEYVNNRKNTNYFEKISNIIYDNKSIITIDNINSHSNDNFFLVENISKQDEQSSILQQNAKNALKNIYNLESNDQVNNENSFFNNIDSIDSDALITKILVNCGASFNNIHDGSFTNYNYKNETDLNYKIYNSLINNKSLKAHSAISLVKDYDIIKNNNNNLNITSPFYTNTLSLPEIRNESNKIEFKNESAFSLAESSEIETNFFNFKESYGLLFEDEIFKKWDSSLTEIYNLRNEFMPWLTNNDMSNISVSADTSQPDLEFPLIYREITDDEFKANFGLNKLEYVAYKNNLLELDAFIYNNGVRLSLIYFDADSVIRQTSDNDSNNIKYLSAPTFCFYSSFDKLGGDVNLYADSSFENALSSAGEFTLGGLPGRSICSDTEDLNVTHITSHSRNNSVYLLNKKDLLRFRCKKWEDLDLERVSYAYSNNTQIKQSYNDHEYEDKLGYFFDRCWTIIAEDKPHNDRANISFIDNIGFGAINHRYSNEYKLTSTSAINDLSLIPTIKSKIYYPFICAINTNKSYDFSTSDLKDKFLNRQDNLMTTKEEKFSDRVILSSTSRKYPNEIKNFVIKAKNESTSGTKQNDWIHRAFKIKRNLFSLKELLLKDTELFNFLKSKTKKCDNIIKSKAKNNVYALIHNNNLNTEKLYSLEESPFLIKKNDFFYTKNNFLNVNNNKVKMLSQNLSFFSQEEIRELESFTTINEYKEFMSLYYPKSFLKNSSTFFKKVSNDIVQSLNGYTETYFLENKDLISFEKLLLDKVYTDFDVFKMLVYIIFEKDLLGNFNEDANKQVNSFFEVLNDKTSGLYNTYLRKIFSIDNIQKQETYTLRTLNDYGFNKSKSSLDGEKHDWRWAEAGHGFFGTSGGDVFSYLFPYSKHRSIRHSDSSNLVMQENGKFRLTGKYESLSEIFAVNTYNYDAYLDVNKSQKDVNSLFTKISDRKLNVKINYIVLKKHIANEAEGDILNEDINNKDANSTHYLTRSFLNILRGQSNYKNGNSVVDADDDDKSGEELIERIPGNLFFESHNTMNYDYDMTLDLLSDEKTFTSKIISYIKGFITYLYTDEEIKNFIASDFINSNEKELKIMHNLINEYIGSCLFAYEKITKLSFYKNIYKEVMVDRIDSKQLWWDHKIRDEITRQYNDISLDTQYYNIEEDNKEYLSKIDQRRGKRFYLFKEFSDNRNIHSLFEKSDYLEILDYDLVYAYLSNFQFNKSEMISNNEEQLALSANINVLSEEITRIENINFNNLINNNLKICKISKNMQNNIYYNRIKVENLNRINTSRLRNLDFNEYNVFDDKVILEENKKTLADIGLKYFMSGDNIASESFMKSDVLRFGIPYNLANALSNKKVLKISVYPVNHKYPELEFYPYEFLYTPILTSLSPASVNLIEPALIDQFLGLYDINANDFRKKYSFVTNSHAVRQLIVMLSDIEIQRQVMGFDTTLDISFLNAEKIIKAAKFSNSVKYLNDSFNNVFDENKINRLDIDFDNIITGETLEMINSFDPNEFLKIFGENYEDAISYLTEENGYTNIVDKRKMVDNNIHSIEFFNNLDKDMTMTEFLKPLTTDAFFDIFSVRITRESLKQKVKNKEFLENFVSRNSNTTGNYGQGFSNSYTYVITTEIY